MLVEPALCDGNAECTMRLRGCGCPEPAEYHFRYVEWPRMYVDDGESGG